VVLVSQGDTGCNVYKASAELPRVQPVSIRYTGHQKLKSNPMRATRADTMPVTTPNVVAPVK